MSVNRSSGIFGAGLNAPRLSTKEMLPPEFIQSQCSAYNKMLDTQLSVGMHALNTQYSLSVNAVGPCAVRYRGGVGRFYRMGSFLVR